MKLRNKNTGEIIELLAKPSFVKRNDDFLQSEVNTFNSLAELNEEWEDYKEPKECWYINENGGVMKYVPSDPDGEDLAYMKYQDEIGNYFETEEEAEKAVEKLKAWKRLKDKGFRLEAVVDTFFCLDIYIAGDRYKELKDDLMVVFGGENDN